MGILYFINSGLYNLPNKTITPMICTGFLQAAFGIVLPIAYCLKNKKKPQNQSKSIKQIVESCLVQIKQYQKSLEAMGYIGKDQIILQPFQYVANIGGKKIRLCMAILLSQMFADKLDDKIIKIGGLIEFLHTASLIIDDIEDGSILRRQKPCSHLIYGLNNSINAANLIYFLPFQRLLKSFHTQESKYKIISVFIEQMVTCHLGQAEDVLVHKLEHKRDLPTLDQYYRLISAKTSSLLRMMVNMIGVVVGISHSNLQIFTRVMNYVGISFQITDDILNLSRGMGKGIIAQDLHQKKFTIIVHFLRENDEFMEEFIHPRKSDQSIRRMLQIIDSNNVIPLCKNIAQQFSQKALLQVQKIECPFGKSNFIKLIKFIITRDR